MASVYSVESTFDALLVPTRQRTGPPFPRAFWISRKLRKRSQRVREVVILAVGTVWKSDYNLYAHGDHICRYAEHFGDPGDETALKMRRVKRR